MLAQAALAAIHYRSERYREALELYAKILQVTRRWQRSISPCSVTRAPARERLPPLPSQPPR